MTRLKFLRFAFLLSMAFTASSAFAAVYTCKADEVFKGSFEYDSMDGSEKNDHWDLDSFDLEYKNTKYVIKGSNIPGAVQGFATHYSDTNYYYQENIFEAAIQATDGTQFNIQANKTQSGVFSGWLTISQNGSKSTLDCTCTRN